jgi:hypothetical protein
MLIRFNFKSSAADCNVAAMPRQALRQFALKALLSIMLTLLLLECGSAFMIYSGRIPAAVPAFEVPTAQEPYAVDNNPYFGAWHLPNRVRKHRRACFSVTYRTNSYGALDIERERTAAGSRTIVLGDSFSVGHGVNAPDRYSNRLEQLTGVPHLNFAAGGTYPTQYFLTYRHMAREFSHDRVLVGILPDNDFDEGPDGSRFRPYWDGQYPSYTLRYSMRLEDSERYPGRNPVVLTVHDVLSSFSFFYSAADYVAGYRKIMSRRPDRPDYAGYFDFKPEQLLRMRYTLEQLHAIAPPGRLAVIAIPRLIDIDRYTKTGKNPFGDAMTPIAREIGFEFIDMLPLMAKAFAGRERELYLGCDGHWSAKGHDFAAKAVRERLYPQLNR